MEEARSNADSTLPGTDEVMGAAEGTQGSAEAASRERRPKRERHGSFSSSDEDVDEDDDGAVALLSGLSPQKKPPRKGEAKGSKRQSKRTEAVLSAVDYSRKNKSLGLLATRFIDMCQDLPDGTISLDDASTTLNVVRRRIYDVVNVLQSIGVVSRMGKNLYQWIGAAGLRQAVDEIRAGQESEISLKVKRGESLGALSRRFLALFVNSAQKEVVSLEAAAASTRDEDEDANEKDSEKANKTKIRRLYDVANIFASMRLIYKHRMNGERKPGFIWSYDSPVVSGTAEFEQFHDSYAYDYEANGELRPEPPARKKSVASQKREEKESKSRVSKAKAAAQSKPAVPKARQQPARRVVSTYGSSNNSSPDDDGDYFEKEVALPATPGPEEDASIDEPRRDRAAAGLDASVAGAVPFKKQRHGVEHDARLVSPMTATAVTMASIASPDSDRVASLLMNFMRGSVF